MLFVVVPAYAVLAIAFGRVNFLFQPVPALEPAALEPRLRHQGVLAARCPAASTGPRSATRSSTCAVALGLCFAIGYPVAYYVARHAKRSKTLLIVLLVIPFWVSYLLRMLAWIGLLSPDGYVNQILSAVGIAHAPTGSTATPTR